MAKDKERSINPAQAQRKVEKAKQIKKAKTEQQNRRNEQLARRNPQRIQKDIDELKALEATGEIKQREKEILASLERDLRGVYKAREALGERALNASRQDRPRSNQPDGQSRNESSVLGKRRHGGPDRRRLEGDTSSGDETDESVRGIPMPRDTPPPTPRAAPRNGQLPHGAEKHFSKAVAQTYGSAPEPVYEAKTTYSAGPQLRDLQKESTARFVPSVVRAKQDAARGVRGQLLEPEEMDELEQQGYLRPHTNSQATKHDKADDEASRRLAEEEIRFEAELAAGAASGLGHDAATSGGHGGHQMVERPVPPQPPETAKAALERRSSRDHNNKDMIDDIQRKPTTSSNPGLFAKLPQPQIIARHVEMEEIEDEDW